MDFLIGLVRPGLFLLIGKISIDLTGAAGALAGRILDAEGNPLKVKVVVHPLEGNGMAPIDLYPYANERLLLQPPWMETFAVGNLPPGEYKISFALPGVGYQSAVVEIVSGRVTVWEWTQPEK